MIVNHRIELSDEERAKVSESLGHSGLVTRKQLRKAIDDFVKELINGRSAESPNDAGGHRRDLGDDGSAGHQGLPERPPANGAGFRPSRGDEPYLYKPRSVALKDACSAMLDQAEIVEQLVWDVLEANREK